MTKPKEKTRTFKTHSTKDGDVVEKEATLTEDQMADAPDVAPPMDTTDEAEDTTEDSVITTGDLTEDK